MRRLALQPNQWMPLASPEPRPCPYLADRDSQLSFGLIAPDPHGFDQLMARGYRRLGVLFYTPVCPAGCRECVPIRVVLSEFSASKSQRRLLRRVGLRYDVRCASPHYDDAHFGLYQRHAHYVSSDNEIATAETYRAAFVDTCVKTHLFEFWSEGSLVGVSILDEGARTVSSVYSFWEPSLASLSPGTYSALWEIDWAQRRGKSYYHLGYWVSDCSRMSYKTRFRPHELMDWATGQWRSGSSRLTAP